MMKRCIEEAILRRRFARQQKRLFNFLAFDFDSRIVSNQQVCNFTSGTCSTGNLSGYPQSVGALIHSEVGSIDVNGWREAQSLLRCCTEDLTNGVVYSLQILDRLSKENSDQFHLEKGSLNFVIANWKNRYIENQDYTTIPPHHVFEMVKNWKCNPTLRPDTTTYFMILEAIVHDTQTNRKKSALMANSVLEYMLEESHHATNLKPTAECFGVVMNAWAQIGDKDASQMVENWIHCMEELHDEGWPDIQPNLVVYNTLLKSWARSNQIKKAENLLQDMLESRVHVMPDSISFTTLLSAYSNRGDEDSALKAEQLLTQMLQLYDAGLQYAKPNVVSFTAVMQTHANAGHADRAEALLLKLERLFLSTGDTDWMPDENCYNTVLRAHRQPEQADSLLQHMYEEGYVKPNTQSFNAVLNAWAKEGGADKAEIILMRMHEMYAAGELETLPTVVTYNIVLDAWAKSNHDDSWKRADQILHHMEQLALAGDHDVTPNIRTWNTVVNCYAKAGLSRKALNTVLHDMTGDRPNIRTWNTVLAACLKKRDVVTAKQAWDRMKVHRIQPDIVSYNTLLSLYARLHAKSRKQRLGVANGIEAVLKELDIDRKVTANRVTCLILVNCWLTLGKTERAVEFLNEGVMKFATGDGTFLPDRDLFHKALNTCTQQKNPNQAESILLKMADLHRIHGYDPLKPTVETYNRILNAWARSGTTGCGERADQVLRQMQHLALAGESCVAPDITSWNSVLKAWLNSGSPIAINQVEHLILEMILKGDPKLLPDIKSYDIWLRTIEGSNEDDKGRRAREALKTMKIHNLDPPNFILQKVQSLEEADVTSKKR